MADLTSIQTLKNNLIRKSLNYSFFAGDMQTAVVDDSIFDAATGEIQALPAGYKDLGFITDDGGKFATAITVQDITSLQSTSPTRSDITGVSTTVEVVCQETNLANIGIRTGVDWANITPDSTNGSVKIDEPAIPQGLQYRLFGISQDIYEGDPVYIGRMLPRSTVESVADQSFSKGAENQWGVTFKGLYDSAVGTAQRWLFGGEGWADLLADMGFSATVPIVLSVEPASVSIAGGDMVTIEGRGFSGVSGASAVKIAGNNATSFTVIDDRTIVAIAPAHASGSNLPIVVTNSVGASTGGATISYV